MKDEELRPGTLSETVTLYLSSLPHGQESPPNVVIKTRDRRGYLSSAESISNVEFGFIF